MHWEFIVAIILAVPIVLFPAAFVWYMNIGGIIRTIKKARERRMTGKKRQEKPPTTTEPKQYLSAASESGMVERGFVASAKH
ncbi:MAG: hypothetical protein ABIH70_09400 [Chloroflexota bacterium]